MQHLLVVAVTNILVEAVELLNVSVIEVVRGEVRSPSEPPFSRHLGVWKPHKHGKIVFLGIIKGMYVRPYFTTYLGFW